MLGEPAWRSAAVPACKQQSDGQNAFRFGQKSAQNVTVCIYCFYVLLTLFIDDTFSINVFD